MNKYTPFQQQSFISFQKAIAWLFLVSPFLGLVLSQTIQRSYFDETTSILSTSFPVTLSTTGDNFQVQFYAWILPIMSNSVIRTQQIARISRSQQLTTSNQATNELLLLTVNDFNFGIQSCVFQIISSSTGCSDASISLTSLGLSGQGQWIKISITMNSQQNLIVSVSSLSYTYTAASPVTDLQLYLYFGYEQYLSNILQFNGFYYYDIASLSAISSPIPSVYTQAGTLTTLCNKSTQLGVAQTATQNKEDDLIFSAYQFRTTLTLAASFILPKELVRITADASIFDSRTLGYCLVCIYAFQDNFILTTFTFSYSTGLSLISIPLSSTPLNQNQQYQIIVDYQQQTNILIAYLNGNQVINQNNVVQPGVSSIDVVFLGDFNTDSYFSGSMQNLQVNYGTISTIASNPTNFKYCQDLCSICDSQTSNCIYCQVSATDIFKDPTASCNCKPGYYFDSSLKCTACHKSCASCYGVLSTQCLTCPSTRHLDSITNSCLCQPYFYDDGVSQSCSNCHPDCMQCLGPFINQCTSCGVGMSINQLGQCVCQKGYFQYSSSCQQCLPDCDSCSNATSCLTCRTNYAINKNSICECAHGFYKVDVASSSSSSSTTSKCSACTTNCSQCSGSGKGDCIKCESGYKLNLLGSCERNLFVEVEQSTNSSDETPQNWMDAWGASALQWSVFGLILIDFLLNVYANTFSFSRVFRSQQFILKIFYLKLISADYTQINYQLISALSYFNGITNIYSYMNPFKQAVVQSSTQIGNKIYLERIPSSVLECSGGVLMLFFIFFFIGMVLSIYIKCTTKNVSVSSKDSNNKQNIDKEIDNRESKSNSINSSFGIDVPLNPISNDQENDIHGLKFIDNYQNPNKDKKNKISNEGQNGSQTNQTNSEQFQKLSSFQNFNRIYQHGFWHFHEYSINVVCFACVLHLVGSAQQPDDIKPQNFFCYILLAYILFVCLIARSFVIRIPKQKKDYSVYRELAMENEKLMRLRKNKLALNRNCLGVAGDDDHNEDRDDDDDSGSSSSSSKNTPKNQENPQHMSFSSSCEIRIERRNKIEKMLQIKWKPSLSESICMKGLFECLHMEFISGFKGCKFFFWFYALNYFCLSTSIASAHSSATGQYSLFLIFAFVGVLTSLIRPYQDILESLKNILDNLLFFIALFLQSIMTSAFSPISEDYTITAKLEKKLNGYAYASAAMMLLAILLFPCLTAAQIFLRRKALKSTETGNKENIPAGKEGKINKTDKKPKDNKKDQKKDIFNLNGNMKNQNKNKIFQNQQNIEMVNQNHNDDDNHPNGSHDSNGVENLLGLDNCNISNVEHNLTFFIRNQDENNKKVDDSFPAIIEEEKSEDQSRIENPEKLSEKIQNRDTELMEADLFGNQQEIINKRSFSSFNPKNKLTKDLIKSRESQMDSNQHNNFNDIKNNTNANFSSNILNNNNNIPNIIPNHNPNLTNLPFVSQLARKHQPSIQANQLDNNSSPKITSRLAVFNEETLSSELKDNSDNNSYLPLISQRPNIEEQNLELPGQSTKTPPSAYCSPSEELISKKDSDKNK